MSDIEALRKDRGIQSWVVFGGSWGSTLSLAYAQINPSRVRALVLRGIFTLRQAEIAWFYERGGAELLMPAAFEQYVDGLPKEMRLRSSLLDAFHEVLNSDDAEAASRAAVAWSRWEGACTYIETVVDQNKYEEPEFAAVFARIEAHFFKNKGFFERDGFLLEAEQIAKIQHIPTVIVQGRWDLVCPIRTAYDLKAAFPSAQLTVVPTAGHSAYEPSITSELVRATDRFNAVAKT